ncbi:GPI biosynthesis protein family Pig-F-domain-containing protein [Xylariaceae sp. FL0594]|nr:GPI biosynthesis protein family Pig-F-domain-containing protein [Xylariaceae sp. FL0594]
MSQAAAGRAVIPPTISGGAAEKSADAPLTTMTHAIRTLQTPEAQALRHAHPVILLALFAARFRALVADPVPTMWSALPAVLAVQAAYTIVCLPPVGSGGGSGKAKAHRKTRPGEKRKDSGGGGTGPNIAVTSLVALVLSSVSGLAIHVLLVLFGAPFLTHVRHTLLCSLHLALLGLYPLFYARGVSARDWLEVASARAPLDEGFGGLVGACVGAWLGAVPIPLDWDRDWQRWPVTILCGVYAGYAVGKMVGGSPWVWGKRFTSEGDESL